MHNKLFFHENSIFKQQSSHFLEPIFATYYLVHIERNLFEGGNPECFVDNCTRTELKREFEKLFFNSLQNDKITFWELEIRSVTMLTLTMLECDLIVIKKVLLKQCCNKGGGKVDGKAWAAEKKGRKQKDLFR